MDGFLIIILMFGALYWLLLRPQQKREKARREMVRSLQAGDLVVTSAGIHGAVAQVDEDVVWLEVAPGVELKLSRDAIAGRVSETSDPDNTEDSENAEHSEADEADDADAAGQAGED